MKSLTTLSPRALGIIAAVLTVASVGAFVSGAIVFGVALVSGSAPAAVANGANAPNAPVEEGTAAGDKPGILDKIVGGLTGGDGPARPHMDGNRPVGLYLMSRYWIATRSLEKAVWYFTPDGRVFHNPEGAFDEASLAAHTGRHGSVSTEGDDLVVNWSDGTQTRSKIEIADGGFNWDTGIFAAVNPFDDSSELIGSWQGGDSISFGGGTTIAVRSFVIRGDGTFSRSAAATVTAADNESEATAGGTSSSNGTWSLDGYTLTMTYGDGKVERGVSFPFDDAETAVKPDRFYFLGTLYKKLGA